MLAPGTQLDEADVIAHARSLIATYKAPRKVVFTSSLPELPSGKVAKNVLREQIRSMPAATTAQT